MTINKNSNNRLIFTLTEKSTLTSPTFLFDFNSDVTGESVCFIAADLSSYPERFNEFIITETSGTNIYTSGTITLEPEGQWTYKVYEQTSTSNLIPQNADNYPTYLEVGIIRVKGTETNYNKNTNTDEYIVNE